MKTLILAGVAAAVAATPIAAQAAPVQQHRQVVTTIKQRPNGTIVQTQRVVRQAPARYGNPRAAYRQWQRGQRFDRRQAVNYRQVDYRRHNRLYAPPRGYQWVQSGNDAVLVAVASGLIGAVIGGALFN